MDRAREVSSLWGLWNQSRRLRHLQCRSRNLNNASEVIFCWFVSHPWALGAFHCFSIWYFKISRCTGSWRKSQNGKRVSKSVSWRQTKVWHIVFPSILYFFIRSFILQLLCWHGGQTVGFFRLVYGFTFDLFLKFICLLTERFSIDSDLCMKNCWLTY